MAVGEGSQGSDVPRGTVWCQSTQRWGDHSEKGLSVWSPPITAERGCRQEEARGPFRGHGGRTGTRVGGQLPGGLGFSGFSWDRVDRLLRPATRPVILRGRRATGQGLCVPTLSLLIWGLGAQLPLTAWRLPLGHCPRCTCARLPGGGGGGHSNVQLALSSHSHFLRAELKRLSLFV